MMCCGHAGLPSVMHTIGLSRKDQLATTMQLATSILIKQKAEYRSVKNLDRKSVLQHSGIICSASHDELQIMFNPIVRCFCSSAHSWKHVSHFHELLQALSCPTLSAGSCMANYY